LSYTHRNSAGQPDTNRTAQAEISNEFLLSFPVQVKPEKLQLSRDEKSGAGHDGIVNSSALIPRTPIWCRLHAKWSMDRTNQHQWHTSRLRENEFLDTGRRFTNGAEYAYSAQRCQSLMKEFSSSVIYIEVEMSNHESGAVKFSRGTAFLVSDRGFAFTNYHVIQPEAGFDRSFHQRLSRQQVCGASEDGTARPRSRLRSRS
jgi:hypothetical protein